MSYRDPYNAGHAGTDSQDFYNPYNPQQYRDEQPGDQTQEGIYNNYPPPQRVATSSSKPSVTVAPVRRVSSGFEQGEFTPGGAMGRSKSQTSKDYRYGRPGNLCTKGGRVRCIGRICCCSLMTAVFLIVSIVLALALWIRPPTITIGSLQLPSASGIHTSSNGLSVDLGVKINVVNPNYFSVDSPNIKAELFYPIDNTPVGGGSTNDIVFKSHSTTNFTFPLTFSYNSSNIQDDAIITSLATKCVAKSNISINYKITLGIRILVVTISPVVSNTFSFPCPISASDISKFLPNLKTS